TDVIVGVGMERLSVLVAPLFLGVVAAFDVDRSGAPVLRFAPDVIPPLEQQDPFAGWSQPVGQSASAGTGADDDHIEMMVGHHADPPRQPNGSEFGSRGRG